MNNAKYSLLAISMVVCLGYGFSLTGNLGAEVTGYDKSNMDITADPCTDFYQYAVGGWMKNNPIPATESRWGSFNILSKQNDEKIKIILGDLVKTEDSLLDHSALLVKNFYLSATDTIAMDYYGYNPLQPVLSPIRMMTQKEELPRVLATLKSYGVDPLFSFYVSADAKRSGLNIIHLSQAGINLPDVDYYTKKDPKNEQVLKDYKTHIQNMLELTGEKKAAEKAALIVSIESELAHISMSRTERRDPEKTYNLFFPERMNQEFGYLNWNIYFSCLGLPDVKEVIVSQPGFFTGLNKVMGQHSVEEWKTFLKWAVIHEFSGVMGTAFENESFRFYSSVLRGVSEMKPREERAVNITSTSLAEPLGKLFVKKHFSEESKTRVSEMVEELREVFRERIEQLEWMSDSTKIKAKLKLAAFKYKIGYPDVWKDYSALQLSPSAYLDNIIAIRRFSVNEMKARLGRPVDRTEWSMSPQTVNAYYSSNKNEIVFPAGILQPPFFDPNAEDALNYGGIGAVIGHEFSHGFDDKGSKFDEMGNLRNWWTEQDLKNFEARTGKIVSQFNSYQVLGNVFINGSLTQGENIADLAGLTMAYYALQKHYKKYPAPAVSPDGFTWQQRFFLGWSIVWAQNISEKELRNRIITDPHSPGRYRVVGPLSNMPEFWQAFSCKPGDPMVAGEKIQVKIW